MLWPVRRLLALLVFLLAAAASRAQSIVSLTWDPMAIRSDRVADVSLAVETTGAVGGVRIDLPDNGSISLTSAGANAWRATVPASRVLFGYASDDVNHNFAGFVRLLSSGGQQIASYNAFVNVLDGNVPPVSVVNRATDVRQTPRIVNIHLPGSTYTVDLRTVAQRFYTMFGDDFDFLQFAFTLPVYPQNRYHFGVRNDVQGIGLSIRNDAPFYGSAGRLKGITVYPIDFFFDLGEKAFSHELGHQWIQFTQHPLLQPGIPHWPISTMATGVMGYSLPGGVGGDFNWSIEPVSSTTAITRSAEALNEFADFDLYLMGLISAAEVAPGLVLQQSPCPGCTVSVSPITVNDIINRHGPRVPDPSTSQKSFRIATIVISRHRVLNDEEMALYEFMAQRGEARQPMSYTSGFSRGTTKPFYVATRGLATVDFRLSITAPSRRRSVRR